MTASSPNPRTRKAVLAGAMSLLVVLGGLYFRRTNSEPTALAPEIGWEASVEDESELYPPLADEVVRRTLNSEQVRPSEPALSRERGTRDKTTSIEGRVLWPDERPAVEALVYCEEAVQAPLQARSFQATLRTGPEGEFRIDDLDPLKEYWILSSAYPEEASRAEEGVWFCETTRSTRAADPVILRLAPSEVFQGTVVDDTGASVDAFRVDTDPWNTRRYGRAGLMKPVLEASEAGGKFSLGGFFPGSWTLQVQGEGSAGHSESSRSLAVVLPGDRLRGRFVLPRRAKLSGRVVDERGEGVAGVQVTIRQRGMRRSVWEQSLWSDERGGFFFDRAPLGAVALYAEQPGLGRNATSELRLEPGEDRRSVILVLAGEGDPRRLGRVIGLLAPELGDIASQFIWMSREGDPAVRTARAERDGSFSFEGIAAGRYLLSSAAGRRLERFSQVKPGEEFFVLPERTVDLSPGEEVHVVLGASSALKHVVSGRVTENGRPLGGVMLEFQTERDGRAYRVQVDELGAFSLATVSPGTARVLLMDPVLRTTAQLQAQIAETPRSDLHLELASSRMNILVRGRDLQPAAGMSVRVYSESSSLEVLREGRTDDQGRISLLGPEPGPYRLYVGHRAAPQAQLWAIARGTPSSTLQSISWSGGSDSPEFEVQLEAGAELSLQVERANGLSVDGVEMSLRYEPSLDPALQLTAQGAGSTGRLFYYGLPAGKARLLARDGGREQFSEVMDLRSGEESRVHFVLNF